MKLVRSRNLPLSNNHKSGHDDLDSRISLTGENAEDGGLMKQVLPGGNSDANNMVGIPVT